MSDLTELAERCEKTTGPDRELDCDIAVNFGWRIKRYGAIGPVWRNGVSPPDYTASIDAAMTLVPEGMKRLLDEQSADWRVSLWSDQITPVAEGNAKTAALALCAAALKARARTQNTPDSQRG